MNIGRSGDVAAPRPAAHLPVLDGVRGLAVLLVMVHHFAPFGGASLSLGGLRLTRQIGEVLCRVPRSGWCGVDLFFVLSGFLITGILLDAKGSPRFFRTFYARRALRVFPLYYGVLFLVLLALPALGLVRSAGARYLVYHSLPLWCHAANWIIAWKGEWVCGGGLLQLNHFWSLSIEEQFYLLWPLAVFALGRRRLMAVCAGCVLVAALLRSGLALHGTSYTAIYVLTPCRMDALAAGAWLAAAARGPQGLAALIPAARVALITCGEALIAMAANAGSWSLGREGIMNESLVYTLLAVLFTAMLVMVTQARGAIGRAWAHPALRFFGKYSYGLYVFHSLLAPVFDLAFPARDLKHLFHSYLLGAGVSVLLSLGASIAAAMLSFHLYEKHFLKLKRLFEYQGVEEAAENARNNGPTYPPTQPMFAPARATAA